MSLKLQLLHEPSPQDPKAVRNKGYYPSWGGPLEEISLRTGGSNRKVMMTTDTRRHQ